MTEGNHPPYRLLGPLEVYDRDRPVPLAGRRERTVLAVLLLRANQAVSVERLIDAAWRDALPANPVGALQTVVSRLRPRLRSATLSRTGAGYALIVDRELLDVYRAEALAAAAREARGEHRLEEGLALV